MVILAIDHQILILSSSLAWRGFMVVTRCLGASTRPCGSLEAQLAHAAGGHDPDRRGDGDDRARRYRGERPDRLHRHVSPDGAAGGVLYPDCAADELLSNNAVAVLLTPVAMSLAVTLGVSETPFLVAILFGASASFMTPFGYQTNAIVMGPGATASATTCASACRCR